MRMNTISKMTVGCSLAILVLVISSGSNSMIQVNATIKNSIQEAQISNIPEIYECQMLHPSWNNLRKKIVGNRLLGTPLPVNHWTPQPHPLEITANIHLYCTPFF